MHTLSVALVQSELHWADAVRNRAHFAGLLESAHGADLVVLPEMFTTGFSMDAPELAETMDGASVAWMREQASRLGAVVTGSLIVEEGGNYYNRLVWMGPDGNCDSYDKRHLFRMAGENQVYAPGGARRVFELKGFRICPQICYDLRFPVWSRCRNDYDVLLYVANWPERRREAWNTLLRARAIENLSYVVAVNRIGTDANGLSYSGDSCVVDPAGQVLFHHAETACVHRHELSLDALQAQRTAFPAHLDADEFSLG